VRVTILTAFVFLLCGWLLPARAQQNDQSASTPVSTALAARPVMMTSFAFILGLYPLVVATGASQLARRTPVFGGVILASFIGIFAIPPLYVVFRAIRERLRPGARRKRSVELVQKLAHTDAETHEEKALAE
jgi:AcrB/AcrD/AcrF family